MSSTDAALNAICAAGLRVVVAGEDDFGVWIVSVAVSRKSEMKTWRAGRGQTLAEALTDAIDYKKVSLPKVKAKPKAKDSSGFEELLG